MPKIKGFDYKAPEYILKRLSNRVFHKDNGFTTECWEWRGGRDKKGYGMCFNGTRNQRTHITYYLLIKGEYDKSLELDHLCRVRNCVNPDHLEPVTHAENIRRGMTGIVGRNTTHCPKGHPYSDENTRVGSYGKGRVCRACGRAVFSQWQKKNSEKRRQYKNRLIKTNTWKNKFSTVTSLEDFQANWIWCNRRCKSWINKADCNCYEN